jgi:molybdopterin molybdotransferase
MGAMSDDHPSAGPASCVLPQDVPPMLRLDEARARMVGAMRPVEGTEDLDLPRALGRVLARDVRSALDVPSFRSSIMDGYAFAGHALPASGRASFEIVGTSRAGRPCTAAVGPGHCVRIMTGAPLPEGADTVVMQEQVMVEGGRAQVGPGHRTGEHVRAVGGDVRRGAVILQAGQTLHPARLGLAASVGIDTVTVRRGPRVAVLSTGDELRPPGATLEPGQIHDSNRCSLLAMLARLPVEVIDRGVIADTGADTERALATASSRADAILSTGGVSVGDSDHVIETLQRHGEVEFWKVAMKPGKPVAFGRFRAAWFFGLPGNPVSALVTFCQLVRPALLALAGVTEAEPDILLSAACESRLRKQPGRLEFQRGVLQRLPDGRYAVRAVDDQGSSVLRSMSEANCFIVLPLESGDVEPGAQVEVQPFSGLGLA